MSFKEYKKGLPRKSGPEFSRYKAEGVPKPGKFKLLNPWWARRRHPGWEAYHAAKKDESK